MRVSGYHLVIAFVCDLYSQRRVLLHCQSHFLVQSQPFQENGKTCGFENPKAILLRARVEMLKPQINSLG